MCICSSLGRSNSIFDLSQDDKTFLANRLPQLTEKKILMIAKHILMMGLDNLADYLFTNGKIYTMDENNVQVEAVAIKGGTILFAGKMTEAILYRGENTKTINLYGRVMLPGFIDPHVHMAFTMFRHWTDLGPFVNKDLNAAKERAIQAVEKQKSNPDTWIKCQLYDPTIMQGQFDISLRSLDKISPKNPIFILQANGHVAHVNSAALKIVGFTKETQDPPHGRLGRDQNGELNGQLHETAVMMLNKYLINSAKGYQDNFRQFLQHCSSKGCTTLNDCGIGIIDPKADMAVLLDTVENNAPVRYAGFLVSTAWKTWMEQKMEPDYKDGYLRIHGIKCWADGSTTGGTAYLREDYKKPGWGKGHANYTLQQLTDAIKMAHDNDWQVAVHANGDAGIDLTLDAYQAVIKANPKPKLRHRIEHCAITHKQQLVRMKQLNITPSFLIGHTYYYGYVFQKQLFGQQRANKVSILRSAIDMGLTPTMHSDYNVTPVDPLRCIYNAVTRKMKANNETLNPKECLTPYEAVKMMTINAAWQCHMDDIVGSIEKGKKADFVILDQNPITVPESEIINIKVSETWMDGQCRYKEQK